MGVPRSSSIPRVQTLKARRIESSAESAEKSMRNGDTPHRMLSTCRVSCLSARRGRGREAGQDAGAGRRCIARLKVAAKGSSCSSVTKELGLTLQQARSRPASWRCHALALRMSCPGRAPTCEGEDGRVGPAAAEVAGHVAAACEAEHGARAQRVGGHGGRRAELLGYARVLALADGGQRDLAVLLLAARGGRGRHSRARPGLTPKWQAVGRAGGRQAPRDGKPLLCGLLPARDGPCCAGALRFPAAQPPRCPVQQAPAPPLQQTPCGMAAQSAPCPPPSPPRTASTPQCAWPPSAAPRGS